MSAQLRPLLTLRWRMVRSRQARYGFLALAAATPALCLLAVAVGRLAPDGHRADVVLLAPTALLPVAILSLLAPLAAGGGYELFPDDHLCAYPVTARTQYLASLALIPLNVAWTTQVIGLVGLTAFLAERGELVALPVLTTLAYVVFVTVAGQALAWLVTGMRQRSSGRRLTWAVAGCLGLAGAAVLVTDSVGAVLDRSPTVWVVVGALNGASGASGALASWWWTTLTLVVASVLAHVLGRRACAWALRRPGDAAHRIDAQVVARRAQGADARAALLATDRASVWRSPSLRRGLLVLGTLPGLVAAAAGLDWPSLVLLPGLVAAGAGLLFGVNAFCLDGSGARWLASMPGRPGTAFWCKSQVVAEVCLTAMAVTVAAGSLRADRLPSSGEAAAILACAAATLLRVVATCMELSVEHPHQAELRGPRDTPAPPGVMAAYSARLALSTTLVAVVFSALAELAAWHWSVLVALPLCLLSFRRLVAMSGRWDEPGVRSRVVATVASG